MRDLTLTEVERLEAQAGEQDVSFQMDEDTFRTFYDRTAHALWGYLSRVTGDDQLAEDLVQEAYYRFLRAGAACESEAHRRHYLFRIATNLVRDGRRRRRTEPVCVPERDEPVEARAAGDVAAGAERRTDLARAMGRLKPRERELLWLAYAQGSSHREIADALGLKTGSVKLLLFRARRKLAGLLRVRAGGKGAASARPNESVVGAKLAPPGAGQGRPRRDSLTAPSAPLADRGGSSREPD